MTTAHERVFGQGVKFDDNGKPIEQGIGAIKHRAEAIEAGAEAMFDKGPLVQKINDLQDQVTALDAANADLQAKLTAALGGTSTPAKTPEVDAL